MECIAKQLPYEQTGFFSKMVVDYIKGSEALLPFFYQPVSIEGIKKVIEERKHYPTNRILLHTELIKQYSEIDTSEKVSANIDKLLLENTFTITTAHQPNIFTGHLYFIYKILHAVKIAEELSIKIPGNNFVPVYYMGSEDADLEELGHVFINGEKHEWQTDQSGAVGRMKVDGALVNLIEAISGQVAVYQNGNEIIDIIRSAYREGITIEAATFKLVDELFASYGLLIVLPDNPELKRSFIPVIEKELVQEFSHKAVEETAASFPKEYKLQANGREINMFYLIDDKRERIEKNNAGYTVVNASFKFTEVELLNELNTHPERFSPNVILRPVFQETILPNIVFIGGGGEIAYWLELKKVFEAAQVPYPVMVVRNSFMLLDKCYAALTSKLNFTGTDLFKQEKDLLTELVKRDSKVKLSLENERQAVTGFYDSLKDTASAVDITLQQHVASLQTKALKKINALEKKMLKAEKKKFEAQQRQLHKLKTKLFPNNNLQERVENVIPFYAKWGKGFIETIYNNSLSLEQAFVILEVVGGNDEECCG